MSFLSKIIGSKEPQSMITAEMVRAEINKLPYRTPIFSATTTRRVITHNKIIDNYLVPKYDGSGNIREIYDEMDRIDSKLHGAITQLVSVVQKSYTKPVIINEQKKNSDLIKLRNDVDDFLGEIAFEEHVPDYLKGLLVHGDTVQQGDPTSTDIELEFKPMKYLTIVDNNFLKQKGDFNGSTGLYAYPITKRETYYLNERPSGTTKPTSTIPGDQILHISLYNKNHEMNDILGRPTFGIYGTSPLEGLILRIKLRFILEAMDIKHRVVNVPRLVFFCDMGDLEKTDQYPGTPDEQRTAARTRINEELQNFRDSLITTDVYGNKNMVDVDEVLILTKGVEVTQLAGASTYTDMMPVIKDIDQAIANAIGVPMPTLGYDSGTTFATSYTSKQIMNTRGTSLLSSIWHSMKPFVYAGLTSRGINYPKMKKLLNYIYFGYTVDDYQEEKTMSDKIINELKAGIITFGQASEMLGYPLLDNDAINNQYYYQIFPPSSPSGNMAQNVTTEDLTKIIEERMNQNRILT